MSRSANRELAQDPNSQPLKLPCSPSHTCPRGVDRQGPAHSTSLIFNQKLRTNGLNPGFLMAKLGL